MPTQKAPKTDAGNNQGQPLRSAAAGDAVPKPTDQKVVDLKALEIDADSFNGGDPYNRTGQFLVEQLLRTQNEQ